MNWTLILIGNLIMDSTIVIFVILVSLESHYLRNSDEEYRTRESIDKAYTLYRKQFEDNPVLKSILEDGDEISESIKKSFKSFWDSSDKCLLDADKYYNKAELFSPFKVSRIIIISLFFLFGIILQVEGILL